MVHIYSYAKRADDSWADMYMHLREKLDAAMETTHVRDWNAEVEAAKLKLQAGIATLTMSPITIRVVNWQPQTVGDDKLENRPRRNPGRPFTRWIR